MSVVWSCNEWDQLEEIPQGPFPQQIIEETEEDLREFVAVLEELGITVKRPETWPHEAKFSTIHWESTGFYYYYPRDILLLIGTGNELGGNGCKRFWAILRLTPLQCH